jgi:ribosomal protein L40E
LNWECNDCGNINPHSTLKCLKCGSMTDRLRNWIMW